MPPAVFSGSRILHLVSAPCTEGLIMSFLCASLRATFEFSVTVVFLLWKKSRVLKRTLSYFFRELKWTLFSRGFVSMQWCEKFPCSIEHAGDEPQNPVKWPQLSQKPSPRSRLIPMKHQRVQDSKVGNPFPIFRLFCSLASELICETRGWRSRKEMKSWDSSFEEIHPFLRIRSEAAQGGSLSKKDKEISELLSSTNFSIWTFCHCVIKLSDNKSFKD